MDAQPRASRFVHADKTRRIHVSFEFFPPKTEEMERTLWESITRLAPLRPDFVSVTYGAGGSTRERTHGTVKRILAETELVPAAHLTCVAASCEEVDAVIRDYRAAGVRHIVALRGDPVGGVGERYAPHASGYRNAADLVAGIKRLADVEVSVSAYPEKHPDSPTVEADLDMLAAKVDAGATRAITQFFFENDRYFAYLDRVRARGIGVPVVPGILPVQNFKQTRAFAARCGASIPDWLAKRFEGLDDDAATRKLIAAAVAAEQVLDLVDRGVTDFHFYTMNRADLVYAICHLLGLRPAQATDGLRDNQAANAGALPLPHGSGEDRAANADALPLPVGERAGGEGDEMNPVNVQSARRLRHKQTDAERLLWFRLRDRRLAGWKFKRQVPIDRFIVDFFCADAKLVLEIDGGQHDEQKARDENRTAVLESMGYLVLRFWNNEVIGNMDGVLEDILRTIERPRPGPPHPNPLPKGERERA